MLSSSSCYINTYNDNLENYIDCFRRMIVEVCIAECRHSEPHLWTSLLYQVKSIRKTLKLITHFKTRLKYFMVHQKAWRVFMSTIMHRELPPCLASLIGVFTLLYFALFLHGHLRSSVTVRHHHHHRRRPSWIHQIQFICESTANCRRERRDISAER